MWLYRVKFERENKEFEPKKVDKNGRRTVGESIITEEFIVADNFIDVYDKVSQQNSDDCELVEIKKEVAILSVIEPTEREE